jgi:hypothetical protein
VTVEAYRQLDPEIPVLPQTLKVTKVEDVSREPDAIYGILLLPLRDLSAPIPSGWDSSKLSRIYEDIFKQLKSLPMSCRFFADESLKAFRVYNVNEVYKIASTEAWYELSINDDAIVGDLSRRRSGEISYKANTIKPTGIDLNLIDLVVAGSVKVGKVGVGDKEDIAITITLWASDVETNKRLRFPVKRRPGELDGILTEICRGAEDIQKNMWMLVEEVARRIPRLRENIEIDSSSAQDGEHTLRLKLGQDTGVFVHMKFCLYEKDAERNAKLTKVDCLDLDDFDTNSSWIKCDQRKTICQQPGCSHIVITK